MTPPLNRPNSAGGLLLSILNSWIASITGKNATCPGSGCSTEIPSNRYSFGARPAAVDTRQRRVGRQRDAGREAGEQDERAPVQRELDHLLVRHHHAEAGRLRPHDRSVRRHCHLLADTAHHQIEINACLFAGRQANPDAPHRLEAGQLHVDAVLTRSQARRRVDAVAARHDDPLKAGVDVRDREGGARDGGAGLILDDAGDFAGGDLRESARIPAAPDPSRRGETVLPDSDQPCACDLRRRQGA